MQNIGFLCGATLAAFSLIINQPVNADDFHSKANDYQIVSEDSVWEVMAHNFGYYNYTPYSLQMVDTMIVSASFYARALAAYVLGKGQVSDTSACLELMIFAVQNEINHPITDGPQWRFERPLTDVLKDQYIFNILYLLGESNKELIKGYIEESEDQLKAFLVLTYAAAGATTVREEVRNIYSQSENSYMRLFAVRVMNDYPDTLDIPILKKALKDIYSSEDKTWVDSTAFLGTAQGALVKLGFSNEQIQNMRRDAQGGQ